MPEEIQNLPELQCKRCNWKWVPRKKKVVVCPKCKSPYWDTPRESTEEDTRHGESETVLPKVS